MEIVFSFVAGLVLAGLVILTYPYWPRNRLVQNRSTWADAYSAGTDVLSRILWTSPREEIVLDDETAIMDSVLPFLVMMDRGRMNVVPNDALNPREESYLALAHSSREMSTPKMRRVAMRLPESDRLLITLSRKLYQMQEADLVHHIRQTADQLRNGGQSVTSLNGGTMMDAVMAWVATQHDEYNMATVIGTGEILDMISATEANPELWHILVDGLDLANPVAAPIVDWIVSQDECDRATAALALIRTDAANLMLFDNGERCPQHLRARWEIARKVCERSEANGFVRTGLDLASIGEDNDQSGLLVLLAKRDAEMGDHHLVTPWPVPAMLLSDDFVGSAPEVPYRVVDGALVLTEDDDEDEGRGASVIDLTRRVAAA